MKTGLKENLMAGLVFSLCHL
nr:unnamed protein product [Callosobruchus chinensis]